MAKGVFLKSPHLARERTSSKGELGAGRPFYEVMHEIIGDYVGDVLFSHGRSMKNEGGSEVL